MDKKILARLIMVVCLITGIGQVAFANPGDPWTEIFESVISQDDVAVEPPQKKVLKSLFFVPRAVSNKIAAPAIAEDKVTVDADQDDEKPLAVADEKKQTDDLESYAKELEKKSFLTPHFRVAYATRFECRWTDAGSGASLDVGVWRPICPPGWVRLHHVFVPSTSSVIQPTEPCILVKWDDKNPAGDEKGPYLKKMTGNEWMWDDKGAGSITHGSFWYPKPPPGYVTLGSIGKSWHAHAKFDSLFRCVREDLVLPGKYIGQIYNDTNSGATKPVSVWSISVADGIKEPFLFTSAAHIAPSRSGKPTIKPYVLKALSPDAAFEATKKGVLSAHWKAMVERTQIEIGEVRKAEKEALDKQVSLFGRLYSSELKIPAINLAGGAENFFQIKPVNDSLPSKPFSEKDFAMIAASIQEGNGLQLEKLPQFDRFPILKGATLDNLSVQQGKFADGDEAGQPWLSVSGDAKISFPRFGSVNGRLCFLSRLYKQKGLKSGLFISVPAEVIEKSFGDVARPLFKQLSFSENAFVTYAADEHEWKINEFPAEIRENLASLSLGEDAGLPFAMGESCWLVAEVKESPVLAAPMAFLQSQPPRLLLSAFIPSDRDQDSLLRANLQSRFLPGLLPGGKSLDVAPPVLELQFGKSRKLTFSSELTLKPTSKIEFSIPVQIEFPANGKTAKSISVSGKIAGKWNDAFGIRGLEIENPTISGAFGENPSLGLAGIVDFGEGWKFDVAGAFTATTGLAALRGKLDRDISFNDIVMLQKLLLQKAYPGNKKLADVIPASSLPLQELKLKNPEFCISQIDDTALDLKKGTSFKGGLALGNMDLGEVQAIMLADDGVICKAWLRDFSFGPFKVTGPENKGKRGPIFDLEYQPLQYSAEIPQQHCKICGKVEIAGVSADVLINLQKEKFSSTLKGNFGSLLELLLNAEGGIDCLASSEKLAGLCFSGKMSLGFVEKVEQRVMSLVGNDPVISAAASFLGNAILRIREIEISGSAQQFATGNGMSGKVHCSIFGASQRISVPLKIADSQNLENFANQVFDSIRKISGEIVNDPGRFMVNMAKNIGELGEDISRQLASALGESPDKTLEKAATEALALAGDVKKKAQIIVDLAPAASQRAVKSAEFIGRKAEAAAKVAAERAAKAAQEAADLAAKAAEETGEAIKDGAKKTWKKIKSWF